MAKEELIEEKTEVVTLTIADGVRFGLGFFMVSAVCFAAICAVAWLIILGARYFGLAF